MKLYLVSRPILEGHAAFTAGRNTSWHPHGSSTDAERLIELCGRVCYISFGENQSARTTREYIANLISKGHESVLEHASWTFLLDDVSRGFTHQLVRHRVGVAYSQMSQQYVDQRGEQFFSLPLPEISEKAAEIITEAFSAARHAYVALESELSTLVNRRFAQLPAKERRRIKRTLARSVLPNGLSTAIAVTANARAARHILAVRGSVEGDLEMREFSALLFNMLKAEAPSIVCDFHLSNQGGLPIVRKQTDHRQLEHAS